jgi:hypothetical protein
MVLDKGVRMKTIKGFENEDIIVSDFGEWVGKNYIDYKAEYKRNQKFIEILLKENKQLKDNWNKLNEFLKSTRKENLEWDKKHNCEWQGYNAYSELLIKMQEIEQGSDSNE